MASAWPILDACTCQVCFETYDDNRKCPRMLSCGHSFCNTCLSNLLPKSPLCPSCRTYISFQNAESIPVNFSIKSLYDGSQLLVNNEDVTSSSNFCSQLKKFEGWIENSTNDAEFVKHLLKLKILINSTLENVCHPTRHIPRSRQELQQLCQTMTVFVCEDRYNGIMYGKLSFINEKIFINSFNHQRPDSVIFNFKEILALFNVSSDLPKTIFLKTSPDGGSDDSVLIVIETDEVSPRAKNSIFLCSGLKGVCYKGETMHYGNLSYCYYILPDIAPLVEGIKFDDESSPWKEGYVYGLLWEENSQFRIQLRDLPTISHPKFGVVISGLQELKDQKRDCIVSECGLVI